MLKGVPCREMSGAAMFSLQFDSRGCLIAGNWPTIRKNLSAQRVARPHDIKFARIFPQMPLPKWRDVWYGQLCLMPERMPKVFRLADGVHAAMGYSGIGVCAATALGREVAQMISSGDEDACAMPVSAPRPAPFARAIPVLTDFAVNPLMRLSYRFG